MSDLTSKYAIPQELQQFVVDGFLEFLTEKEGEKTIEFHIPSLRYEDERGRRTTFTLIWIHPNFNEQFCHYYEENPGDLANFYIVKDTDDLGDELIDLSTLDDLVVWLEEKKEIVERRA